MSGRAHSKEESRLVARTVTLLAAPIALLELARQLLLREPLGRVPFGRKLSRAVLPYVRRYELVRASFFSHWLLALVSGVLVIALLFVALRAWLLFWHNQIVARLAGTYFGSEDHSVPTRKVNLLEEIRRRPKGHTFVGLSPRRTWLGGRWKRTYISPRQRTMHRHVMGKTGSGKTQSILWPQVLQDALDGKGVVVMSAKGSDEEISVMKAIAAIAERREQLRVFSLPAWNQPQLASQSGRWRCRSSRWRRTSTARSRPTCAR